MGKSRIEAFSDGVIAIIITIMVLELKAPESAAPAALLPMLPMLFSYLLSFVYVGIYWNNHHHLLYATRQVSGGVLWANLHLLFWLSLVPIVTSWMGATHFAMWPVAIYGCVMLLAGLAFVLLAKMLVRVQGSGSILERAVGRDCKGWISLLLYAAGVLLTFVRPWIGVVVYASVAAMWFIPDRRIARLVSASPPATTE